jgi:hypothetical protein
MQPSYYLKIANGFFQSLARHPGQVVDILRAVPSIIRGHTTARDWRQAETARGEHNHPAETAGTNPLREYFESHKEGRGIWKWEHYFDIYQRHFQKFVGREVHVVEVGIYSGGSLDMWKSYFGDKCRVYGVDIEDACRTYANETTSIFIGDQADRDFWKRFRKAVPKVDILIDDGGHEPEQQIVTLEEMLPHVRNGGVYLCEDMHGIDNPFADYISGLSARLNDFSRPERTVPLCEPHAFQSSVQSVHLYPFATVIEKTEHPVKRFVAPKHGTEWQPFL